MGIKDEVGDGKVGTGVSRTGVWDDRNTGMEDS